MVDAHKKFCKSGVIFTNGRVPKISTLEQQKPGGPQNGIPSETGGRGTLTIRNIPMEKPSLRRDTYPSIPSWICFCEILDDGVTFRDSTGRSVINDGQIRRKY